MEIWSCIAGAQGDRHATSRPRSGLSGLRRVTRGLRSLLRATLFFAGSAGVIGLGAVLAELRAQGYVELGFEHNLAVEVRNALARWIALGAIVGVVHAVLAAGGRRGARMLADRGTRLPAGVPVALGLAAGFSLLALSPGGAFRRFLVFFATLLWCGSLGFVSRVPARGALLRRTAGLGVFAIPPLFVVLRVLPSYHVVATLRQPEVLAAIALIGAAVLWMLIGAGPGNDDPDPLGNAGPWPAAALWSVILAAWIWTASPQPRLEAANPKNVLLIAVDTLRLDHTSLAGGDVGSARTPRVAAWASGATTFTTAISQAPWTMPAFGSIVTGRYPREHAAISLFGRLRANETTLSEVLREAGYWTGGVVSHLFVDADHGFGQGFDHYDTENSIDQRAITSDGVTSRALDLLDAHRQERFFLFLHYFDPHYEYRDHPDQKNADGYHGWLRQVTDIEDLRNERQLLGPEEIAHLHDLYAEEIAFTDAQIGRVLEHLAQLGLESDTAVVFVSDHGEEFLERGWLGHTVQLHDEVVRVPLVMALPGVEDAVSIVSDPVETRGIFATLLDYLQIDFPFDRGDSLLPVVRGGSGPDAVFSEVWLPDAPLGSGKRTRISSVRTGGWKLILDHDRERQTLYDLANDPGETRDASLDAPSALAQLKPVLGSWLAAMSRGVEVRVVEPSRELRERLRALGYLD